MNNVKTVFLLTLLSGLLVVAGAAIGGIEGAILFFGIALAMNIGSYWASAEIVLRTSKAHEIAREDDPALFDLIANVAESSGMPMPRVYVMDSPQPNAFATGRSPKHAAVAVTTGIRQLLTERELRGVLGHEMAHVKNRDILTSSIVATIASAISLIGFAAFFLGGRRNGGGLVMLLAIIVAPIAASLDPPRHQPHARVPGRPRRREGGARPGGAGVGAGEAGGGRAAAADAGARGDGPPLHRQPAAWRSHVRAV